ncbi:MAG: hypothetical protein CFE24_04880 [Flavobacterium sp. BFFFF2]|nr:MAG: hypothetical protein CFE24_04880 [Flavobacterium sp. BFFFF2]
MKHILPFILLISVVCLSGCNQQTKPILLPKALSTTFKDRIYTMDSTASSVPKVDINVRCCIQKKYDSVKKKPYFFLYAKQGKNQYAMLVGVKKGQFCFIEESYLVVECIGMKETPLYSFKEEGWSCSTSDKCSNRAEKKETAFID